MENADVVGTTDAEQIPSTKLETSFPVLDATLNVPSSNEQSKEAEPKTSSVPVVQPTNTCEPSVEFGEADSPDKEVNVIPKEVGNENPLTEALAQPEQEQNQVEKYNESMDSGPEVESKSTIPKITKPSSGVEGTATGSTLKQPCRFFPHKSIKVEKQTNVPETTDVLAAASNASPKSSELAEFNDSEIDTKPSVLTLLAAQYNSDSDSDDVREIPSTQTYQNRCVEIDSDTSSSDIEVMGEVRSPIDVDLLSVGHGDEDDEENVRNGRSPKVRGEFHLDELPPIQDLHITVPEEECVELGKIQSVVEQLVVVNSLPGTVPLDLDTVLFLDKGKRVLGEIFDVLGQVSDPLYCVRFNSHKEVIEKGIEVGQTVYVAPRTQHTQFVVLANLMKVRGSDASWENDIEPPERYLDYSDDEEERSARRTYRNKNRPSDATDEAKRQRPEEQPSQSLSASPSQRTYGGNYRGQPGPQPYFQPPNQYNIAGNSWHSNYYQHSRPPAQQYQNYRMPFHAPGGYRAPPQHMPYGAAPQQPGLVFNPYAMYPPPHVMQQPLFPPIQHPPPPPPGSF